MNNRHIIFVPGKNPKPEPEIHRDLLWRAMIEGISRIDKNCAAEIQQQEEHFSLLAWNFTYYHHYVNMESELPWIEKNLAKMGADADDVREARSWGFKLNWLMYAIADIMPFIIRYLPGPACATARETQRYFSNTLNVAREIRAPLKQQIRELLENNQKVLLIAHSLGTVIAYDALWELSHLQQFNEKIDFLTIGCPLGMHFVQHRLLGHAFDGVDKYPANIRHWINIAAKGDITALDKDLRDDFEPMLKLGLVESITDYNKHVYNWYRNADGLNVHRSYGYLANDVVAKAIVEWWRENGEQ